MNDVQLDIKEQLRGFELWNLKDRIQFPLVYSYTKSSHYRDLGGHPLHSGHFSTKNVQNLLAISD